MKTIFFQLLNASGDQKGVELRDALAARRQGAASPLQFEIDPEKFKAVPGAPFAYWVNDKVRSLFEKFPKFEGMERQARVGDHPADGFRYLRLWWEVTYDEHHNWKPYQKGGAYSPFYYDVHLMSDWDAERQTYRCFFGRPGRANEHPSSFQFFFRPAITWPLRTGGLSFRILPHGCFFSNKGPCGFVSNDVEENLYRLCALVNSFVFKYLIRLQLARTELAQSYEVGLIQQTPVPDLDNAAGERLGELARECVQIKRRLDTANETSHVFQLPALLQVSGDTFAARVRAWADDVAAVEDEVARRQNEIDDIAFRLYGLDADDRAALEPAQVAAPAGDENSAASDADEDEEEAEAPILDGRALAHDLVSYALGIVLGRFDIRLATGDAAIEPLPDPFAPLPACSPAMLQSNGLPPCPLHSAQTPLMIVDDENSPFDIERRLRQVWETLFGADAADFEADLCAALGAATMRDYLRRPNTNGFFDTHLKRYSKSRRQAPIYWPLSTPSGAYTLWIYAPRLNDQTLSLALLEFVRPKLEVVEADFTRTVLELADNSSHVLRVESEKLSDLRDELRSLDENWRALIVQYKPDLNDGALLCAAPLHPYFRHSGWRAKCKTAWSKLERGDFDWAHLAMSIWPDRVQKKCLSDKSLAIAHGASATNSKP